jgi:hypothetical protein
VALRAGRGDSGSMELQDTSVLSVLSLAVLYGMVVLGFGKRRLVWRRKCRVCGGPQGYCRCRWVRS